MAPTPAPPARRSPPPLSSMAAAGRARSSAAAPRRRSPAPLPPCFVRRDVRPPCRHAAAPPASTSPLAVATPCRSSASSVSRHPGKLRRPLSCPRRRPAAGRCSAPSLSSPSPDSCTFGRPHRPQASSPRLLLAMADHLQRVQDVGWFLSRPPRPRRHPSTHGRPCSSLWMPRGRAQTPPQGRMLALLVLLPRALPLTNTIVSLLPPPRGPL